MSVTIVDLSDTIAAWRTKTNTISSKVGDLNLLTTVEQSDIVGATNELKTSIDNLDSDLGAVDAKIGDLSELTTTDKATAVDAMNELNRRLVDVFDASNNLLNN